MASIYALLEEFPGAKQIAAAHLTRLNNFYRNRLQGPLKEIWLLEIRDAARNSLWLHTACSPSPLDCSTTIRLILELDNEIAEIEEQIQSIMDELHSIPTIPGLGSHGSHDLAEVGDFTLALIPRQAIGLCWDVAIHPPVWATQKLLPLTLEKTRLQILFAMLPFTT